MNDIVRNLILQMNYKTMAQDRDRWTALVNAAMNLQVP